MIFAVFNEGAQWSLDLGPHSVILTVENLIQEKTISSQEIALPAWNLLLFQRQEFLDNDLLPMPVTPNQN